MTTNPEGDQERSPDSKNKSKRLNKILDDPSLLAAYNEAVQSTRILSDTIQNINKSNYEVFHIYTKALEPLTTFENQFKALSSLFPSKTITEQALDHLSKQALIDKGYLKAMGSLYSDNFLSSKNSLLTISEFTNSVTKSIASIGPSSILEDSIFSKYASLSPLIESSVFSSIKIESALSGISALTKDFNYLDNFSQSFANKLTSILSPLTEATRRALLELESHGSANHLELIRIPAVELYTSAHATACVTLEHDSLPIPDQDIEQQLINTNSLIIQRLYRLNPGLAEAYTGGMHALKTGGPDWQRHAMVSFRETLTHVIHILAPDNEVIDSGGEVHEGRPTRKARIRFIFSGVGDGLIHKFFEADIKAAIELFDLLSNVTHKLGDKPSLSQLHYLQSRLAGLLSSMLAARGL